MLRIVGAIIGLELCEQSCAERAEKIHASEAARRNRINNYIINLGHSPKFCCRKSVELML